MIKSCFAIVVLASGYAKYLYKTSIKCINDTEIVSQSDIFNKN